MLIDLFLSGVVSTLAGTGSPGYLDGVGSAAKFYGPLGITLDPKGNLYIADEWNHRIRKVSPNGIF
jgi:DNA-binding beta-propeller fold protein YncE